MKRWAVVGSRSLMDYRWVSDMLSVRIGPEDVVVSGGAGGADRLAERWARAHDIKTRIIRPDWSQGRGAGFARNSTIVDDADEVLAFWDGMSRGTADTIRKAEAAGKPVTVFRFASAPSPEHQEKP